MKRALAILGVALLAAVVVRVVTGPGGLWAGGTAKSTITIAARVDEFSEWADPSAVIFETDWSGSIDHVNQKQTAMRPLTLYTNTKCTISANPALNNGVLTKTGGKQTLDTAYRVTGDVAAPDTAFKAAGQFFNCGNVYTVNHVPGTGAYHINVEVQMASPANAAPDEGVYACGITLTAGW